MSELWHLSEGHDEHVANQIEPIEEALSTSDGASILYVGAGFQFKGRNKDTPADYGWMREPGAPAYRDDTR